MDIETIRHIVQKSSFLLTPHASIEAMKDGLGVKDINYAIFHGKIIEEYPQREYSDLQTCLIYAMLPTKIPIHVVVDVIVEESVVVVTVYIPDRGQWIASRIRQKNKRKGKRK